MALSHVSAPPQIGQLAHVRGRRFVTLDVRSQANVDFSLPLQPQHFVTLASVDDALGDQLTVVWEAEPDAEAIEFDALPSPETFDDAETLDAFLNAIRWGIVNDIERQTYLAPYRSGIQIEDYQLDPLVRAMQMPRANLLLADGVGLGKTIVVDYSDDERRAHALLQAYTCSRRAMASEADVYLVEFVLKTLKMLQAAGAEILYWTPANGAASSMHAKAIVADQTRCLVTSANLTGRALTDNVEIGVLLDDPTIADGIVAHYDRLRQTGWLKEFIGN